MRIDEKQKLHFCSLCLKKQFAKELYEYVLYCVRECHLNKSFVSEEDMGRLLYDVGRRFFHIKTNEAAHESCFIQVHKILER
jgi:hypothetical protein